MYTIDDGTAVKHAIIKRIDEERGCSVADVKIEEQPDCIAVGVLIIIDDAISETGLLDIRSFFDLPLQFEMTEVHNQVDEIAEACKKARKAAGLSFRFNPSTITYREKLPGTGRRRWKEV